MKKIISFVCVVAFSLFFTVSDCLVDINGNELGNNFLRNPNKQY